ncbi:MAG: tetratricopeptide repeat protein [Anaerolineales bacterium]|nr:tetratricopeptide repeat protein [Anaerolineales bacterium]
MSDNRREQIYQNLIAEETEDLLYIWQYGEIDKWDEIVFEIIKEILLDRLGYVPPQSIQFQISEVLYRVEDDLENNELEKALSECELLIQLNPDSAIAYNYRGEIYYEMGQLENAIINFQKAIELDSSFEDAWENMLSIESALEENFEESAAKSHLDKALEYANNGETNKALEECETAKLTLPSIASAYNHLGLIFDTLDLLEPAIDSYRKAIQLNPELKDSWDNMLSVELALEEKFEESTAKNHLDQALEYANEDEPEKALLECETAKPYMQNIAPAYNYLGLILQTANQLEFAIDAYIKAIQLNPRFYAARENLANARVAWEEEQYHLVTNLSPDNIQETSIEFDETKILVTNEPIPQWLYMDEKTFLLLGQPGHRTRQGRSGYDPIDRNTEEARMQAIMLCMLMAGKFRTRNPIYLMVMASTGALFSLGGVVVFMFRNLIRIPAILMFSLGLIIGVALLANVYLSLRLEKPDEHEDNGHIFF